MLFWKEEWSGGVRYTPVISIAEHPPTAEYEFDLVNGKVYFYNKLPNAETTQFFLTAMANNLVHII